MFLELLKTREEYYAEFYKNDKKCKLFPTDYIFDENQTVKWNREQVEIKNQEIKDTYVVEKKLLIKKTAEINNKILEKIIAETNTNNLKCAQNLFELASQYAEDESCQVFNDYLNDLCDLVTLFLEVKENNG
jgi:hypothetical protein